GAAPFDDPGEGMHAEVARELAASGDPLTLTLNGVRYVDKPPLLYVLAAFGFATVGPSEAVARAVPAVAALAAIWATAWLGARLLDGSGGVVAGLALLTSVGFFAFGGYVRPETLFVAALAGGFALCLVGISEGRRGLCVGGLSVFGIAALTKDPLGAVLPPLAIGLALVLAGRARPLGEWLPWSGVLGGLVVGFGWWIGMELRTPGFSWYTAIDNHVLNVARARYFPDEDVPLSAVHFLTVAILGSAPWALASVLAWASDGSRFLSSVVGTTDVASLKSSAAGLPPPIPPFAEFRPLLGANAVVFAAGALVTSLLTVLAGWSERARRLVVFAVITTMVGALPSCAAALGLVASHRAVSGLARDVGRLMAPEDLLVHEGPLENSGALEWYAGRRPVIVDGRRSVLGF